MSVSKPAAATATARTLSVSIEGKAASVAFDGSLFWLSRGSVTQSKELRGDASHAYICVPHALVLYTSFVGDSDGGSLLIHLLAPPAAQRSLLPFAASRPSRAAQVAQAEAAALSEGLNETQRLQLHVGLEGTCANLRLVKVEARLTFNGTSRTEETATSWAQDLMQLAYKEGVKPFRRLKVLVNPIGGPGKALSLFQHRVRPILEAANCRLDVEVTQHAAHGTEIARALNVAEYDAVVCVSGDGMLNEVLQGFAGRTDADSALRLPVTPIPTGSGNATSVNLLGVTGGFSLSLACLNAVKGKALALDVCVVTQPTVREEHATRNGTVKRRKRPVVPRAASSSAGPLQDSEVASATPHVETSVSDSSDPTILSHTDAAPTLPYTVTYSFLSQAIGLMADLDLGTEDMRALGDARFFVGFIGGVLANKTCEVDLYVKLGARGTLDRSEMRSRVKLARGVSLGGTPATAAAEEGQVEAATEEWKKDALGDERPASNKANGTPLAALLPNGTIVDPLPPTSSLKELNLRDPSWPFLLGVSEAEPSSGPPNAADEWLKVSAPISALYAGKLPYVSRDLMQFPYALPNDGLIDVALQLQGGGRAAKLRGINGAETGSVVYDKALSYLKCTAYRCVPRLQPGDRALKKGGLISIDGEWRPYVGFQVEVLPQRSFNVLSMFASFSVPFVEPPAPPGGTHA